MLAANPFAAGVDDPKSLMVYFLARPASGADLTAMAALAARGEAFHLTDAAFYLLCARRHRAFGTRSAG